MTKLNVKLNLPGGIVSIGDFQNILTGAEHAGAASVRFGNRQQLYFTIEDDQVEDLEHHFFISDTLYEIGANDYPNIVSSYVSEDIFDSTGWLREGIYKDILDSFSHTPKLKINLVDSSQTLIPFFTGNFNFISAEISNYWYLYIRFPKTNTLYCWSTLIYSEDICDICKQLERTILENAELFYETEHADGQLLEEKASIKMDSIRQAPSSTLQLPAFQMPCFEGINTYGDKCWLGIYRRDELFSVAFLQEVCALCIQSRIGQIYTTPWRSILIKGIPVSQLDQWKWLLRRYGINSRHAASELNWQTEDLCKSGLELKLALAEEFNRADLAAGDLCFAIKMNPKAGLFGSVVIRRADIHDQLTEAEKFDIFYTSDFNPNSKKLIEYASDVSTSDLNRRLVELCQFYVEQTTAKVHSPDTKLDNTLDEEAYETVFQCRYCLSVYDGEFDSSLDDTSTFTAFADLPDTFCCPLCEAGKDAFMEVEKHKLYT